MNRNLDIITGAERVSIPMTVLGGLQFVALSLLFRYRTTVSIPMTVLGGLQFDPRDVLYKAVTVNVSIPMTVLGGLQ